MPFTSTWMDLEIVILSEVSQRQIYDKVYTCMCVKSLQSCLTLCDPTDCSPPGSSVHGDSPGKNTGVDCHFLLQGIFLTQGLTAHLLHWQADSLPAEPPRKPPIKILREKKKNKTSSKRSNQSKGNKSVIKTPSSLSMVNVSLKHFLELFFKI